MSDGSYIGGLVIGVIFGIVFGFYSGKFIMFDRVVSCFNGGTCWLSVEQVRELKGE